MSPILHQIRCSTSKIEIEQWIGAKGGAGWIALQVGWAWGLRRGSACACLGAVWMAVALPRPAVVDAALAGWLREVICALATFHNYRWAWARRHVRWAPSR